MQAKYYARRGHERPILNKLTEIELADEAIFMNALYTLWICPPVTYIMVVVTAKPLKRSPELSSFELWARCKKGTLGIPY